MSKGKTAVDEIADACETMKNKAFAKDLLRLVTRFAGDGRKAVRLAPHEVPNTCFSVAEKYGVRIRMGASALYGENKRAAAGYAYIGARDVTRGHHSTAHSAGLTALADALAVMK